MNFDCRANTGTNYDKKTTDFLLGEENLICKSVKNLKRCVFLENSFITRLSAIFGWFVLESRGKLIPYPPNPYTEEEHVSVSSNSSVNRGFKTILIMQLIFS